MSASSDANSPGEQGQMPKRSYSKGGCRECKRRKIKCSEEKPQCWQCSRLKKSCSYPFTGEKVLRVSRKVLRRNPNLSSHERPSLSIHFYKPSYDENGIESKSSYESTKKPTVSNEKDTHTTSTVTDLKFTPGYSPSIVNLLNEGTSFSDSSYKSGSSLTPSVTPQEIPKDLPYENDSPFPIPKKTDTQDPVDSKFVSENINGWHSYENFSKSDLNTLAMDLNNLVSDIIFDSNLDPKALPRTSYDATDDFLHSLLQENGSLVDNATDSSIKEHKNSVAKDRLPRHVPMDFIEVKSEREKRALQAFYNDFAEIILPFSSYDNERKAYFNPARDMILKCASYESFLLAAVLAQGAKALYKKYKRSEDETAYGEYLSKCLKLLVPALKSDSLKNDSQNITSHIENVLLTVLLLTCGNASNSKQDWRPHLRGAKDILLKVSSNQMLSSKILIFCKFWFIAFEILAGLSSKKGGTLKTDSEIDSLITTGTEYECEVLRELGAIEENGFDILCGYNHDCICHLRDLIKILNKMRKEGDKFIPDDSIEYLRLLSEFYKQNLVQFVNSKCILSPNDFENGIVPQGHLIESMQIEGEQIVISWKDTSHQAYVLGAIVTLLTKFLQLPYDAPQVQTVNKKIIHLVSFLRNSTSVPDQTLKCSMMMIQWPLLIAAKNCIEEEHKYLLEKFFRMSTQVGSGSAIFAWKMINKIWKYREDGTKDPTDPEDDTNVDIMSY